MQSCCFWKTLLIPLWDPECFYLCVYAASFWLGERAARHKVDTNLDSLHKHTCFSYTATVVWIGRWTCNLRLWVRISAPAGIVHDWGETFEQGTEPPTALRAPHCRLPTAPSVCALGWVKCREHISLLVILCIIVYVTNKAQLFYMLLLGLALCLKIPSGVSPANMVVCCLLAVCVYLISIWVGLEAHRMAIMYGPMPRWIIDWLNQYANDCKLGNF